MWWGKIPGNTWTTYSDIRAWSAANHNFYLEHFLVYLEVNVLKQAAFIFDVLYGSYGDYIVSFVIYIFRNLLSRWDVRVNLQLNKK